MDGDPDEGLAEVYGLLHDIGEVVAWVVGATHEETTPVNPYCYWEGSVGGDGGWADDAQVEAVFGEDVAGIVATVADTEGGIGCCGFGIGP